MASRTLANTHAAVDLDGSGAARTRAVPGAMRILLLNYEYPPLGGGAGIASAALAQRLVARGAIVDVVTSRPHGELDEHVFDGRRCTIAAPNLTLYRVWSRRRGIHQAGFFGAGSYLMTAVPVARRLMRRHSYDVVHIFFSLPTGALIPALPIGPTPLVVSLRGSDVPGYDERNPRLVLAHRLMRPLTKWIWRRASRVVPVCESLGELACETSPSLRYTVIGNGVDLELFRPLASPPAKRGTAVRCLAVTRLIERKGLGDLLRAWAMLERGRFTLEIVGGGPDEHRLRALAAELEVTQEITFAGALSREEVARRCQRADLFVLTPHEEAFGNVFAEALAAGLPVIATSVGAIPDLIRNGDNGILVPAGDSGAIARALRELGDDAERRVSMSARNRARAETMLSWETAASAYLSLYAELARARRETAH